MIRNCLRLISEPTNILINGPSSGFIQNRSFSLTTMNLGRGFKQGRGTGDSGQSSLYNNERRWKDDDSFNALGATDELSSFLGVCGASAQNDGEMNDVVETLTRLQCCLQDVGAHLATPPKNSSERKQKKTAFDVSMVEWINAEIDRYGDELPGIRQFILSGGGVTSANLQYARAVCRRAERCVVPLIREENVDPMALKFLNRMSDLLFVLGRTACMRNKNEELTYLRPDSFTNMKWDRKSLHDKKK
ncbi:CRE-MMAB-1 protein [Caenorhabditis remanei]|uniref:Corrinoid adenosyltransferase MMAB n=1 Tax=Caenorhabditis remanei TaxID=31234 RepID=E3MCL8_CAERE|nr:CRE-MMAB-1 protein [Caenorhabditis remanei]